VAQRFSTATKETSVGGVSATKPVASLLGLCVGYGDSVVSGMGAVWSGYRRSLHLSSRRGLERWSVPLCLHKNGADNVSVGYDGGVVNGEVLGAVAVIRKSVHGWVVTSCILLGKKVVWLLGIAVAEHSENVPFL
jgi:hypothetical protein